MIVEQTQGQIQELNVGLNQELWEELCEYTDQGHLRRLRNRGIIMTLADVIPQCIHNDFMSALRELEGLLRRGSDVLYAEDDVIRIGIWASLHLDVFHLSDDDLEDLAPVIRDTRNPLRNAYLSLYWRNEVPVDDDYIIQEILKCMADTRYKDINTWIKA